jgi:4-carboxymuconolactone decarboxylase
MARVPTIQKREDLPASAQDAWNAIAASRGHVVGPFTVLLHTPELAKRVAHVGEYVRFDARLPAPVRELAILSVAREMDCRFEWAGHVPIARKAGVRPEAIDIIRERRAPAGLTSDEAQVVGYASRLVGQRHRVDEPTFRALEARFGLEGLVELTALIGYYGMLACTLNAFDVMPDAGMDQLPV